MNYVVVDTDVVSFLFKLDSRAALYRPHLAARRPIITFMTRAELYNWAAEHHWGQARRRRLEAHLLQYVHYDSHEALCYEWAEIRAQMKRLGRVIGESDAWQAATARLQDIPLIAHNRRDFAAVPRLTVISEAP